MADETKIMYCCDRPQQDNSALWATAMRNNWNDNPLAYIMTLGVMRFMFGDNWQNNMGNSEINSRFNQLQTQLSDNHNADIIVEAVKGNSARLGELAGSLNVDIRAIQSGICDLRSGVQQVSGDTKLSAERVINALNSGDTAIIAALKDCCCQNKELVIRGNYENQLATERQTGILGSKMDGNFASLQLQNCKDNGSVLSRIDQLANGITQGFSASAYESARLARDTQDVMKYESQRQIDAMHAGFKSIEDKMCQSEINSLRAQIEEKDRRLMVQEIISQVKAGCGCGC